MAKGTSSKRTKSVKKVVAAKVVHLSPAAVRPSHEDVARRAYAIFEREGRIHGRHEQHWQAAEAELLRAPRA